MKILVVGATGATGRLVVGELLKRGHEVSAIVRSADRMPGYPGLESRLLLIEASIADMSREDLKKHVEDCDGIVSCLGHNLTWKGIYGKPRRLVADSIQRLYESVQNIGPNGPVRIVLMNTTGNRNENLYEKRSLGEMLVIGLIRLLLPPQKDNEAAVEYLRTRATSSNGFVEWSAVRPDSLIDSDTVSQYTICPSPLRSPIFNAGKTSRINVAHFMAELLSDNDTWSAWNGQMPVIYNQESLA